MIFYHGVRCTVRVLVCLAISSFAISDCPGKEWTFTIDPNLSQLELSGQFAGVTLNPQDAEGRSPIAAVSGWLAVDLDDANRPNSIHVKENTLMVENSGSWLPEPLGGPAVGDLGEATAANFAMWFNDPTIGQGWGAIRNVEFQLLAEPTQVSQLMFEPAPRIETLQGEFDYNVPSVALADRGQEILRENLANVPNQKAELRMTDLGAEIIHPIRMTDFLPIDLLLEGWIVAGVSFPWRQGDFDGSGTLTAADIDLLSAVIRGGDFDVNLDLNRDGTLSEFDRAVWVHERRNTYFGDADLNGLFDSGDLVSVFVAGEYEDDIEGNSNWPTGDWEGDGDFASSDFIVAFQDGGYEAGPRVAQIVPEVWPGIWSVTYFVLIAHVRKRRTAGRRNLRRSIDHRISAKFLSEEISMNVVLRLAT
jgi:hypothetical protein